MRKIAVALLLTASLGLAVEAAYRVVFHRALLRLVEKEEARRGTTTIETAWRRFGTSTSTAGVCWFEDAFEAVRDRVMPESRLRPRGDRVPAHAYFFADFYQVEPDFDRAMGKRGYLWSPRTWSFHAWPD